MRKRILCMFDKGFVVGARAGEEQCGFV